MRIRLGLRDAWSRYWASLRQQRLRRLEGFAASRPGLYVLLALLIGLSGYAFIFAWPLITALLIIDVLGNVPTAQQTGHWGLILIETAALALTGWISVRFAQMAPRGPSGLSL
ncbi:MAG: hypothetical protein PVG82_04770, partial [Chromatiales bacterium]